MRSLEAARSAAAAVLRRLRRAGFHVVVVGSVRRREARIGDLDFLVRSSQRGFTARLAAALRTPARSGGERRAAFDIGGFRADFFRATRAEWPWALFHLTGPKSYNVRVRALARLRGQRLNQYGLFSKSGVSLAAAAKTERDVCAALGVTYRAPPNRG
jgi:DNA polymerase (family 10)